MPAVAVTVPVMGTLVSVVAVNSPPASIKPIPPVVAHNTSASTITHLINIFIALTFVGLLTGFVIYQLKQRGIL